MRHRPSVVLTAAIAVLIMSASASEARAQQRAPYQLPATDAALQAGLTQVMRGADYRRLVSERRVSVALVDITDPNRPRYAGLDDDRMRYAASLPKVGILLGFFDQVDRGVVTYTPELRTRLERMIRNSDNRISSEMIQLVGFPNIARALEDPRHKLYDPARKGGIWVGRGYGSGVGLWRRDRLGNISHGATARQAARFLVMMQRGELVSPWASAEMKSIMAEPRIHHKFVRGLETNRPGSLIYRKSGTWENFHADMALVERDGRRYVAVVLLESPTKSASNVLAKLIVRFDDLIFRLPSAVTDGGPER